MHYITHVDYVVGDGRILPKKTIIIVEKFDNNICWCKSEEFSGEYLFPVQWEFIKNFCAHCSYETSER